jgi:hypothetical protein
MATDERGDVTDQSADRDGGEQGDDQRRVNGYEKHVDPHLLGVLQGNDDDDRDEKTGFFCSDTRLILEPCSARSGL